MSADPKDVLDDLERVHLQLAVLEFRVIEADGFSVTAKRLSELGDDVKVVIERLLDVPLTDVPGEVG